MRARYAAVLAPLFKAEIVATRFRTAFVNAAGLVEKNPDGAYVQADNVSAVQGTGVNATVMPLQTALVVSLNTSRSGPSGKGRFYVPWPAHNLGADYRLSTGSADAIADAFKSFFDSLKADAGGNFTGNAGRVAVFSYKGFISPVTGIRVGRVPDTQRSRRGDMVEGYSVRTLA